MARGGLDSHDVRALAREFVAMSQAEISARFKGSAMKRAKRRGLARSAAWSVAKRSTRAARRHHEEVGSGQPHSPACCSDPRAVEAFAEAGVASRLSAVADDVTNVAQSCRGE